MRIFWDQREHSRVIGLAVAKFQSQTCKIGKKTRKTQKMGGSKNEYCFRIRNWPKAWIPCRRHGYHAKGMETMPKAWKPCQRHGNHGLCLIVDIRIFLAHAHHHTLMPGASDNGREDGSGSVIPGGPSFTHARAVVNDQSGNIVITRYKVL